MPDDPGLLAMLGIRVTAMFAGIAGGIVGAWADNKAGLKMWAAYIVSGGLTANYLAEPVLQTVPWASGLHEGGAGFIVGGCALVIMKAIIGAAQKWHPQFNGGKT